MRARQASVSCTEVTAPARSPREASASVSPVTSLAPLASCSAAAEANPGIAQPARAPGTSVVNWRRVSVMANSSAQMIGPTTASWAYFPLPIDGGSAARFFCAQGRIDTFAIASNDAAWLSLLSGLTVSLFNLPHFTLKGVDPRVDLTGMIPSSLMAFRVKFVDASGSEDRAHVLGAESVQLFEEEATSLLRNSWIPFSVPARPQRDGEVSLAFRAARR